MIFREGERRVPGEPTGARSYDDGWKYFDFRGSGVLPNVERIDLFNEMLGDVRAAMELPRLGNEPTVLDVTSGHTILRVPFTRRRKQYEIFYGDFVNGANGLTDRKIVGASRIYERPGIELDGERLDLADTTREIASANLLGGVIGTVHQDWRKEPTDELFLTGYSMHSTPYTRDANRELLREVLAAFQSPPDLES